VACCSPLLLRDSFRSRDKVELGVGFTKLRGDTIDDDDDEQQRRRRWMAMDCTVLDSCIRLNAKKQARSATKQNSKELIKVMGKCGWRNVVGAQMHCPSPCMHVGVHASHEHRAAGPGRWWGLQSLAPECGRTSLTSSGFANCGVVPMYDVKSCDRLRCVGCLY
jgi:hypothetical protein